MILDTIEDLLMKSKESDDFVQLCQFHTEGEFWISYFTSLVDSKFIHTQILPYLKQDTCFSLKELQAVIPMEYVILTNDVKQIQSKLMLGHIMIQHHPTDKTCLLIFANMNQARDVAIPEEEFSVVGPKNLFRIYGIICTKRIFSMIHNYTSN
ncbi:spore germination protein, partial [Bacillus thuringiensis]